MGKKKNRRPVESDSLAPSHAEVRFSTRRAAKISNYNEDDEDGFSEDEAMLTPNYSATGPAENVPAIDIVLNHRLKDETGWSFVCCQCDAESDLKYRHNRIRARQE
jgi:chromodomain-helicase-DNA-binding protein 1